MVFEMDFSRSEILSKSREKLRMIRISCTNVPKTHGHVIKSALSDYVLIMVLMNGLRQMILNGPPSDKIVTLWFRLLD